MSFLLLGGTKVVATAPAPEPEGFTFSDNFAGGVYGGVPATTSGPDFSWHTRSATIIEDPSNPGEYVARFRYGASSNDIVNKYWIGQSLNEFWMAFDWEVPSGVTFQSPIGPHKLFQIWRDVYSNNPGGTMQWGGEFWRTNDNEAYFRAITTRSTVTWTGTADVVFQLGSGSRFISPSGPVVPGQRHNLRFHFRPSSVPLATDGAWRMWIDGVLFCTTPTAHDLYNRAERAPGDTDTSIKQGYVMGYNNTPFPGTTDFLLPNFLLTTVNPGW